MTQIQMYVQLLLWLRRDRQRSILPKGLWTSWPKSRVVQILQLHLAKLHQPKAFNYRIDAIYTSPRKNELSHSTSGSS